MRRKRPALDRFLEKIEEHSNGCWLWTAACFSNGYGAFRDGDLQRRAHRWSYEHYIGPIPEGDLVMHSCDTPRCVNPEHLSLGSSAANQADMTAKGRGRVGWRNGWRTHAPKLTVELAQEIRLRYAAGGVSQTSLGDEYGVTQTMIGRIVRGEAWA